MSTFELGRDSSWGGRPVARRLADAAPRSRVRVTGRIVAAKAVAEPSGGRSYRCQLEDGTGRVELVFLGRRGVPGLVVGACVTVEATVRRAAGGGLVAWDPFYRLEPDDSLPGVAVPDVPTGGPGAGLAAPPEPVAAAPAPEEAAAGEPGTVDGDTVAAVESAGHFRIYLGAAAGVGKTYAMLSEGRRRRARGTDVVVAFAECHHRPVTEALLEGQEVVPSRVLEYRGARFEEMDLDAVLARAPRVALVDELAHTNVPGSGRNAKRWQDVLELLDAGIDVITTVNIQHLESMADAVEHMTGSPVRERVPDRVVRRADQIELVDSSPEQLRRRMLHGNIYAPDKVPQALTHFFRTDNLIALRELALRFLADETDEVLLARLRGEHAEALWETTERILVGVTTAPGTEGIIRRASRMAGRLKTELQVVHVVTDDAGGRPSDDERLAELRRLASDVGATWHEVRGDRPAAALVEFARGHQITQIVIGSGPASRWQELRGRHSVVRELTRLAAAVDVDVHVIARRELPARAAADPATTA